MNKYLIVFILILVQGCSSGDGGDSVDSVDSITPTLADIALADIVGVWDDSKVYSSVTDEMYTVIRADGTGSYYDYMGDSFDNFGNCYEVLLSFTVEDLGGGNFLVDGTNVVHLTITNGALISVHSDGTTFTSPPTTLHEFNLAPLCS